MIRRVLRSAVAGLAGAAFICSVAREADAQVTTITIKSRVPFANGQAFGTVGPYEEITGLAVG